MRLLRCLLLLCLAHTTEPAVCHGQSCSQDIDADQEAAESGIVHIEWHYNDNLCLEILLIDCDGHVTEQDDTVCGTNGKEYENHCLFAHARCQFLHSAVTIDVANLGPCPTTSSTLPPTEQVTGIQTEQTKPQPGLSTILITDLTTAQSTSSTVPFFYNVAKNGPSINRGNDDIDSNHNDRLPPIIATSPAATTIDPLHNIVFGVFCRDPDSIICRGDFNFLCGSDGHIYPNECELAKVKCKNPNLVTVDMSVCSL